MPAVTRELTITYGGFSVGGSTDYLIDNKYQQNKAYGKLNVSFEVVASGATEGAFATACANLEAAFRKPRQDLVIAFGGSNHVNGSHSGNTFMNAEASIEKLTDGTTTGRSRRYRVSIEAMLPADLSGVSGRRSSSVRIEYDNSRIRTVTISGEYTALGSNSALAQYEASIGAYCTAVLSALGGTYELQPETPEFDDQNKLLRFNRVYRELVFNQSADQLDHPAIKAQTISVDVATSAPGDSPMGTPLAREVGAPIVQQGNVLRPVTVTLRAEMNVDKTVSQDLAGLWTSTVRPWLIQHAMTIAGSGFGVIVEITPTFDSTNNRIGATLTMLSIQGGAILSHRLSVEVADNKGRVLIPVWVTNPLARHKAQGPRTILRTTRQVLRIVKGAVNPGQPAGKGQAPVQKGGGAKPPGKGIGGGAGGQAPGMGVPPAIKGGANPAPPGAIGVGVGQAQGGGVAGLQGLGIELQDVQGIVWERLGDTWRATPDRIGIAGYAVDVIDLEIEALDAAYVPVSVGGGGGPGSKPLTGQ